MILKLNDKYLLRGWKGAGCALVNSATNAVRFYNQDVFNLLLLCDGVTTISEDDLSEIELDTVKKCIEEGILIKCDIPSPIAEIQEYKYYPNRFVHYVLWSITGRCNFNCRHCYMDAPNGILGEISHEDAMSFIDQMAECGVLDISLTGGEPLVRSDIKELIAHITHHRIKISQIYTNGWLLDESFLDFLDSIGQKPEFNFSFDGLGWHDWMRGVDGSEQQVLDAIRLCQSRGFSTGVEMSIHKGSADSIRETVRTMGELNTHIKIGSLMITDLWKEKGENMQLTFDEYFQKVIDYIPQFFEDGMPTNLTLGAVVKLKKGSKDFKVIAEKYDGTEACLDQRMCGAARSCLYISPEGRLLPCMPMTNWKGHTNFKRIQDTGLQCGLTDGFYMSFVNGKIAELFEKNKKCNNCEYKLKCGGGCRAIALEATGDLYGSDLDQCNFWKNGYVDIIRKTTEEAIEKYCK